MSKKIKVIKEKEPKFKEIVEEEIEGTDEELEEETEHLEEEPSEIFGDFTEFVVEGGGERIAPILQVSPTETTEPEPLEKELENVPAARGWREDEAVIYNMPDYTGYEQAGYEGRERQERAGFELRDMSNFSQREDNFELRQAQEQTPETEAERIEKETRKYHEAKRVEHEEEERKLPFSRERRKRERVLKS